MPMVHGEFRRTNGFEFPPDRLQMLSYMLFAFMISSFYALLVPLTVESGVRTALIVIYALLLLGLMFGAFTSSRIDPVDSTIYSQLQATPREVPSGELLYCCFCKCKVHKRSKHCRVCNKCVGHFDHHCKWLNNCIGGENYNVFFFSISIASTLTGLQLAWNAVVLKRFLEEENLHFTVPYLAGISRDSVLAWVCVSFVVAVAVFTLLLHLVIFHIFLNTQGISTYDYILKQRAKKAAKKEEDEMRRQEKSSRKNVQLQETRIDGGIAPGQGGVDFGRIQPERVVVQETAERPPQGGGANVVSHYIESESDVALGNGTRLPGQQEGQKQGRPPSGWTLPGSVAPMPSGGEEGGRGSPELNSDGNTSGKKTLKPLPPKQNQGGGSSNRIGADAA